MPSITQPSARLWSHPQVRIPFLGDRTYQPDELFPAIPFIPVDGPSLQLNFADVPDPQVYAVGGSMGTRVADPTANPGTSFTGADASAKNAYDVYAGPPINPPFQEFFLKEIVGDVDISRILRFLYGNANDLRQLQVDMKLQVVRYHYSEMFINGVGTTATDRDFAGLTTLVSAAQTVAGTGSLVSDLDALEYRVRPRQGKADFFLMDYLTFGLYLKALRLLGCTPEIVADPLAGGARVAHNGVPIYRSHHLYTTPATYPPPAVDPTPYSTAIYCGCFGLDKGGVVGLYREGLGQNGGIVEDVGAASNSDFDITRVSWLASAALASEGGLAKLTENLTAVAPYTGP